MAREATFRGYLVGVAVSELFEFLGMKGCRVDRYPFIEVCQITIANNIGMAIHAIPAFTPFMDIFPFP